MEDEHIALDDAALRALATEAPIPPGQRLSFFAVIDGHGGRDVAGLVKEQLPLHLAAQLSKLTAPLKAGAVKTALRCAYESTAVAVGAACEAHSWRDGACVIAILIVDDAVFVAGLGDSKVPILPGTVCQVRQ
jgi:serine/threonine protein phosphatase PrpC